MSNKYLNFKLIFIILAVQIFIFTCIHNDTTRSIGEYLKMELKVGEFSSSSINRQNYVGVALIANVKWNQAASDF